MNVFNHRRGDSPLLLSMPHSGTELPQSLADRLVPDALALPDTDWHVPRLYAFAEALDASVVQANYSRYVIDLNRPPDNVSLYPGQATTELCPSTFFDGRSLYREGQGLAGDELEARRAQYWQPYHDQLAAEMARIKARHGYALLYDCHSIASVVPRLFDGLLPVLNVGTARSQSCAPGIEQNISKALADSGLSHVMNGRFVGGYITRNYGQPAEQYHAVQMELGQDSYMNRGPGFEYREDKAQSLQTVLQDVLKAMLAWQPA
jgi:N-formylglutamate amidohydrolase